jgi:hypothetical protein
VVGRGGVDAGTGGDDTQPTAAVTQARSGPEVASRAVPPLDGPSARVADAIVAQLAPRTVLDAGGGLEALVSELRARGVEATGVPASALGAPLGGPYDLVCCVEVLQHVDPTGAAEAVAHLAEASDRVLFASSPDPQGEAHARPVERWSQLFAAQGLLRDFRHEAGYLSPWAVLYRRQELSTAEVVLDYDRAWAALRAETVALRTALAEAQDRARAHATPDETEELRKEILRLRDLVVGQEAELATALGRVAELESKLPYYDHVEQRLHAVLESNSWRLGRLLTKPLRLRRERD